MRETEPHFSYIAGTASTPMVEFPLACYCRMVESGRNMVTEEKSKPAESLAEFRGNYKYNLLDGNVRAFNADVPIFTQGDDHEVTNDWRPGEETLAENYSETSLLQLIAVPRTPRFSHEFMPIRENAGAGRREL